MTTKVADWQTKTFEDAHLYRAMSAKKLSKGKLNGRNWHKLTWHNATLYAGMDVFREVAAEPAK